MSSVRRIETRYWSVKRRYNCTKHPFSISLDDWRNCWMSSPIKDYMGKICRINERQPWTVDNIHYVAASYADQRKPRGSPPTTVARTLTLEQWAQEIRAKR